MRHVLLDSVGVGAPCVTCESYERILLEADGDLCCKNCGTVIQGGLIDLSPPTCTFAAERENGVPDRVHWAPSTDGRLGCVIDTSTHLGRRLNTLAMTAQTTVDANGRKLPTATAVPVLDKADRLLERKFTATESTVSMARAMYKAYTTLKAPSSVLGVYAACIYYAAGQLPKGMKWSADDIHLALELEVDIQKHVTDTYFLLVEDKDWHFVIMNRKQTTATDMCTCIIAKLTAALPDATRTSIKRWHREFLAIWDTDRFLVNCNQDLVTRVIVTVAFELSGITDQRAKIIDYFKAKGKDICSDKFNDAVMHLCCVYIKWDGATELNRVNVRTYVRPLTLKMRQKQAQARARAAAKSPAWAAVKKLITKA